jgi:hypothetical protein
MAWADRPEAVRVLAEQRLWWPTQAIQLEGESWQPLGLHRDGGAVLGRQGRIRVWHRRFDEGPDPPPPRGRYPLGLGH